MNLSSDKVTLRAPEPEDLDFLYLLENDPDVIAGGNTPAPVSRQQLWTYIQNYSADIFAMGELRLVVVDNSTGQAVGTVDISSFSPHDRNGYVGIAIAAPYRGRGLGAAALKLLCRYAAVNIGMHTLVAAVAEDNHVSRSLFASCGFRTCGRLRSWIRRGDAHRCDAQLYQRMLIPVATTNI